MSSSLIRYLIAGLLGSTVLGAHAASHYMIVPKAGLALGGSGPDTGGSGPGTGGSGPGTGGSGPATGGEGSGDVGDGEGEPEVAPDLWNNPLQGTYLEVEYAPGGPNRSIWVELDEVYAPGSYGLTKKAYTDKTYFGGWGDPPDSTWGATEDYVAGMTAITSCGECLRYFMPLSASQTVTVVNNEFELATTRPAWRDVYFLSNTYPEGRYGAIVARVQVKPLRLYPLQTLLFPGLGSATAAQQNCAAKYVNNKEGRWPTFSGTVVTTTLNGDDRAMDEQQQTLDQLVAVKFTNEEDASVTVSGADVVDVPVGTYLGGNNYISYKIPDLPPGYWTMDLQNNYGVWSNAVAAQMLPEDDYNERIYISRTWNSGSVTLDGLLAACPDLAPLF